MTAVQVLYAGTSIFMRTYIIDLTIGWTEWVCLGGISFTGGDTAITLSDTQESYIKTGSSADRTSITPYYYSNLLFQIRCSVTLNTDVNTITLKIDDNATFTHYYISSSGYAYGPNEEEFKYVMKDKNTIILTCTNGFKANSQYKFSLFGMYEPIG